MEIASNFDAMPMPRRSMPQLEISRYKIYTDRKAFVEVEAASAMEAMRVSQVKDPCKVVRDMPLNGTLLGRQWLDVADVAATPAQEAAPAAEEVTTAEAAPAEAPAEVTPPAAG